MRDDEQPVPLGRRDLTRGLGGLGDHALAPGKARLRVQLLPIVHDDPPEAEAPRDVAHRLPDVPGAEHDQARATLHWLHEDLHSSAAAHAQIAPQVLLDHPRAPVAQAGLELGHDVVLDGATPDGADRLAAGQQEQARAGLLGRRAARPDHRGQRATSALIQQPEQGFGHVTHAPA